MHDLWQFRQGSGQRGPRPFEGAWLGCSPDQGCWVVEFVAENGAICEVLFLFLFRGFGPPAPTSIWGDVAFLAYAAPLS